MDKTLKFSAPEQQALLPVYKFSLKRKKKLFLVGGALRDRLLGRKKENPDFDFALKNGAIAFGRALAKELKCGFVVLDVEHGACRVVRKTEGGYITYDFTDFRAKTIENDLKHRDFTVNALSLQLKDVFLKGNLFRLLLDPTGGIEDLDRKMIRSASEKSFSEDPLRILRAFSFSSLLGFEVDQKTLRLAVKEKSRLPRVSGERVRDELFKVFSTDQAFECFDLLDKLKILMILFPEFKKMRGIGQGPYHHLDVWQHTLETLKQLEGLFIEIKNKPELQGYLDAEISGYRRRRQLLKLGALLHDVGKPAALRHEDGKLIFHGHERLGLDIMKTVALRLKLSNDEMRSLHKIILWHLRPGYMADSEDLTARAKFRFFRDTGNEAVNVLLLSIADQRATKGPFTTRASRVNHEKVVWSLIKEHYRKAKEKKEERLLNGDDLIKEFHLKPSPLIGDILKEIEELQVIGKLKTKEAALKAAKKLIKKDK